MTRTPRILKKKRKKRRTMTRTPRTILGVRIRQTNRISCIVGATTKQSLVPIRI